MKNNDGICSSFPSTVIALRGTPKLLVIESEAAVVNCRIDFYLFNSSWPLMIE